MDVNGGRCLPSLPSSFLISRRPFTPELKSLNQFDTVFRGSLCPRHFTNVSGDSPELPL